MFRLLLRYFADHEGDLLAKASGKAAAGKRLGEAEIRPGTAGELAIVATRFGTDPIDFLTELSSSTVAGSAGAGSLTILTACRTGSSGRHRQHESADWDRRGESPTSGPLQRLARHVQGRPEQDDILDQELSAPVGQLREAS
jgi:hypothetical protein